MNSAICLLERAAGLWGERCALADEAESLSYAELRARSRRAAETAEAEPQGRVYPSPPWPVLAVMTNLATSAKPTPSDTMEIISAKKLSEGKASAPREASI